MTFLRRTLYASAAVWVLVGALLTLAPRVVVVGLLGLDTPELTWVRVVGILLGSSALVMVLIGQNLEETWWWSWAFAIAGAGITTVVVLHALLGVADGAPIVGWWALGALTAAGTACFLYGLAAASHERPFV